MQGSYPADERLMAIDGGQVGTMYQAVESITDQLGMYVDMYAYLYVYICVYVHMYICMYVYVRMHACMHTGINISCSQISHFCSIYVRK